MNNQVAELIAYIWNEAVGDLSELFDLDGNKLNRSYFNCDQVNKF